MSDLAPTPSQVLDSLVKRFAAAPNPDLPFHDPVAHARRRLVLGLIYETFGPMHPLARLTAAYRRYESRADPPDEFIEECLDNCRLAWADLEQELQRALKGD